MEKKEYSLEELENDLKELENAWDALQNDGSVFPIRMLELCVGKDENGLEEFQITLKNQSGKDINYIKFNICKEDEIGNIYDSTSGSWIGIFRDGSTQQITKRIVNDYDSSYTYVVYITDVSYT